MMMRTTLAAGVVAGGLVAIAGAPAAATETHFFANMSGDHEVPPTGSGATGNFTGVYDSVANTFSFEWEIFDLEGDPTNGSHIHRGAVGENGPIVFGFNNPDNTWPLAGSAVWSGLSQQDIDDLFAGMLYVNFHTNLHPPGELRGQIIPAPGAAAVLALAGLGLARRRR